MKDIFKIYAKELNRLYKEYNKIRIKKELKIKK